MAFCTCVNIGNILGAQLSAQILKIMPWGEMFLWLGGLFVILAILMVFFLVKEPSSIGIYIEDDEKPVSMGGIVPEEIVAEGEGAVEENVNFCKAWCLPNVILYASAFFLCKFAVYAVMFNLPTFLQD